MRNRLSLLAFAGAVACVPARPVVIPPAPVIEPLEIGLPALAPLTGSTLAATASRQGRGAPDVSWSAAQFQRAWVAPNGTLVLLAPGEVTLRAHQGLDSAEQRMVVRKNPAAQVVMRDRVLPGVGIGDTVRVQAFVYDDEQRRIADAPVAYALVARGEGTGRAMVTEDGRFVAHEPGVYTVVAECGKVTAWTAIIVESDEDRFAAEMTAAAEARDARDARAGAPPRLHDATVAASARGQKPADTITTARTKATLGAVTVTAPRTTKVAIDDPKAEAYEGTTLVLSARVWTTGRKGHDTTARPVWTSSDREVAYVNQHGRVVFLRPGSVEIAAAHAGRVDTRRFEVRWHPAARVALRPGRAAVQVGQPVTFREDVFQPGGYPVRDARVNYAVIAHGESDEPVAAAVSEKRVFTAQRPGVYTVIAEVGGVADKFTLFVMPAVVATTDKPAAKRTGEE